MIDLHSHLLPGVDDGSRSVEQSVGVLRVMAGAGVAAVCLTPHLAASRIGAGVPPAHDAAYAHLLAALPEEGGPRLYRGAEIMLDRPLPPEAVEDSRLRLAGTRHVLVEFPRLAAFPTIAQALGHVRELGLVAVLAHPERYVCCAPGAVTEWRALGARMQVDATTLLAASSRGERARRLVAQGLADILAADNHGDRRSLASVRDVLIEQGAGEQAELLLERNPRSILEDGATAPVPPFRLRLSWIRRLRSLLEEEEA